MVAATVTDPAFALVAAAAFVAGLVRGFSGFGTGMVFIPVAAAVWSPAAAIVMLLVFDNLAALPMVARGVRLCVWREVMPLALGSWAAVPLGVWVLATADPDLLRWGISLLVLGLVSVLATGWRWHGRPSTALSLAVGASSGFAGGAVGLSGPPVILFWLSGMSEAAVVRANIIVFFALSGLGAAVSLWVGGLITAERLVAGAALLPVFGLGLWLGTRGFGRTGERPYRRAALALCAAAAVVGLPAWT